MQIREYKPKDETGWLRCRVLAFLDTAYFDDVYQEREKYNNPSIELVAEENDQIVGLIDIEYESTPGTVCSDNEARSGMIWNIAVHPDYHRKGIAGALLKQAASMLRDQGIYRAEAWTRDDKWVNEWYEKHNFKKRDSYYHVFMGGKSELEKFLDSKIDKLKPVAAFAHYSGDRIEEIKQKFDRAHECRMYELIMKN